MTCTKTGAHIWIEPYNMWAYGDAFEIEVAVKVQGGFEYARVAYFKIVATSFEPINNLKVKHYTVYNFEEWIGNNWAEEEHHFDPPSVLITADFFNEGYEGTPI